MYNFFTKIKYRIHKNIVTKPVYELKTETRYLFSPQGLKIGLCIVPNAVGVFPTRSC